MPREPGDRGERAAEGNSGFSYGRGRSRLSDEDARVLRRYYPIFENLVLFVLNSGRWVRNFRGFLRQETSYRSRLLLQGFIFLTVALGFVFGAALMLVFGLFFLFRDITGSDWLGAFLNGALGLLVAGTLFLLFLGAMRRIMEARPRPDVEDGPPGYRRRQAARRESQE